jgi:hypothetical protein
MLHWEIQYSISIDFIRLVSRFCASQVIIIILFAMKCLFIQSARHSLIILNTSIYLNRYRFLNDPCPCIEKLDKLSKPTNAHMCEILYYIILYYIILYFTHLCASVGKHLFIPSFKFSVKYIFYHYLLIRNYPLSSFNHSFIYLFVYLLKRAYIYLFNYIYLSTFIKYLSSQLYVY